MTLAQIAKAMAQCWPFGSVAQRVLEGYRALGAQYPQTLTDIALRNHVFADAPANDAIALAIAEGRRRCALEIFQLANVDHGVLWDLVEKKPKSENRT